MSFSEFKLKPELLKNLTDLGLTHPTPIQSESLPSVLDGRDVIAKAKTGSGKTLAFGLGILQKLDVKQFCIQTLVLCPTRELADQVAKELRKLARQIHNVKILTLCGGMPMGPQIGSLEHGAHIIVGTPGRIDDHRKKGRLKLDRVSMLVLDEADRMLDMGFRDTLEQIIDDTPSARQTLLFSATYPEQIDELSNGIMQTPVHIEVAEVHSKTTIKQSFYKTEADERFMALLKVLHLKRAESCIIFCHTKRDVQDIADKLCENEVSAIPLHGDMDQRDRDRSLLRFANKSASVLVATDVAARGLDIEEVALVVNFQIAKDLDVHTHRVGRTGRKGNFGEAVSLFTSAEYFKLEKLNADQGIEVDECALPDDSVLATRLADPAMHTIQIEGGKKHKIRPGDLLGALTSDGTLSADEVGKINIFPLSTFVAVKRRVAKKALARLQTGKVKGRQLKARLIRR